MASEQPDVVSLAVAAERLGLSTEAVRKRIQRGTLPGQKINGAWFVGATALPSPGVSDVEAGRPSEMSGRRDVKDSRQDSDQPDVRTMAVDLAPFATLIERLHDENQRLTEAATMWQVRARQAEERLAQLEAGPIEPEGGSLLLERSQNVPQERDPGPVRDDRAAEASGTFEPVSEALGLVWRRWWRRVRGG